MATQPKKVLVVYHSQGGNTEVAAQAVAKGVGSIEGVEPMVKKAFEANADDLTSCDAICFGTPDHFSYMAGMLKDFFDRTFYPTQGQVNDKVGCFLDGVYNRNRLHSALGYIPPVEFEENLATKRKSEQEIAKVA